MSAFVNAAHDFGKERRVSGAHNNDERAKGLHIIILHNAMDGDFWRNLNV